MNNLIGGISNKRNGISKLIRMGAFLAVASILSILVSGGWTSAQLGAEDLQTLEGSWDVTITTTPNPPFAIPFRILRTVTSRGVIDAYAFPSITPTQGLLTNSAGHGSWTKIGARLFSATVEYFQLDLSQPLDELDTIGKVRENIRLSKDGNSYVSVFETTIYLPDGTPIIFNSGKTEAKRIAVEPLAQVP